MISKYFPRVDLLFNLKKDGNYKSHVHRISYIVYRISHIVYRIPNFNTPLFLFFESLKPKEKIKLYITDIDRPLLFGRLNRPLLYGRPDVSLLYGRSDSTPLAITVIDVSLLFGRPISPPLINNKLLT